MEYEPNSNDNSKPKRQVKLWEGALILIVIATLAAYLFLNAFSTLNENLSNANLSTSLEKSGDIRSERAQELATIKTAIKEKGAQWEADDNEIFQLSNAERKKRVNENPEQTMQTAGDFTAITTAIPASLDWRNNYGNFVTPIRNQGSCGSCWAFAATASDESSNLIKSSTPSVDLNLSEQILVSCSTAGDCGGGSTGSSSIYIRDVGLPLESCYPYTATNGSCSNACSNWQASTYKIGSYTSVPKDVSSVKQALATYGPIVASFSVYADFLAYRSGVYSYTTGVYKGGHAILIVGYDDPGQYFIVKNSWGTSWGESGYFRVAYSQMSNVVNFGRSAYAYTSQTPALASITVTSPNGGESWEAGGLTSKAISWNYMGDSTAYVKIELLKAGIMVKTLASSVSVSAKSYYWLVPADQAPETDYQVKITSTGNGITDTSDGNFTITPPSAPSLTLTYPMGEETFKARGSMAIKWSFTGNPGVSLKIDLMQAGLLSKTIVTGVNTSVGSYTWKIPTNQTPGTDYQIRITSNSNNAYTSMSGNYFTIAGSGGGGKKN